MIPIISVILTGIGSAIKGFFGFKEAQANVVSQAIKTMGDVSASNAQREAAIAQIISAEANAGGIAANWRPLLMLIFMGILLSFWFGYVPAGLDKPMPAMIQEIFEIIKIGLCGYIPARSIEKIIGQFNISSVLKTLIDKKVV